MAAVKIAEDSAAIFYSLEDEVRSINQQSILERMKKWGYYLLPKSHPESPGYTGLLVAIREKPTEMHFDPESLHIRLRQDAWATWLTLGLRPLSEKSFLVCPGRVILLDRKGKEVEYFTFGGSLETLSIPGETVYSLRSPVPILAVINAIGAASQFAFETEIMLARFEAQWGLNQEGFERQLAQANTTQLYLASLDAILWRFEQSHAVRREYHHLYHMLLEEKKWLQDVNQWPLVLPNLEAILAPN